MPSVFIVRLALWATSLAPEAPASAPFELHWTAPPSCPDETVLRAAVERRLGRTIATPLGDGLVIDGHAEAQSDGRWRVELAMHGVAGEARRELGDASDCAAAVEASALVIAIAIDPELVDAATEPPPVVPPRTPEPTTPPTTTRTEPARTAPATGVAPPPPVDTRTRTRRPTRGAIGATAAISFGDLPIPAGHGRLYATLLRPRVRVELGGAFGGAPTIRRDSATVKMWRWTVDARACPVVAARRWLEVLPCLGAEAGRTPVVTTNLVGGRPATHPWVALLAAPGLAFVPHRAVAIRLGLELRVPLTRHEYTVEPRGRVHQTAPVAGALVAGIEARFP